MRLYPLVPAPAATPKIRAYSSSLSDAEWAVLQPLVQRSAAPQGGRPPKHSLRRIIDAIRYLVRYAARSPSRRAESYPKRQWE